MAQRRYTQVFYAAVAVAILATYGVYSYLERAKASNRIATGAVLVANQDIPEGTVLNRTMLATNQWPVAAIPAGAFASTDSIDGRVTRVSVFKGEPIVPGRLAPVGTGAGLEIKINPGRRAMSVRINDIAGISGLLQPNSRVDVLVNIRDEARQGAQIAKLFMENMRVLSIGTALERGADGKPIEAPTATLEVTPEEAERLAVAMTQGNIQLVLRGYGDPDSINTRGATSVDVLAQLGGAAARTVPAQAAPRPASVARRAPRPSAVAERAAPAAPAPSRPAQPYTVDVYRGNAVQQLKFERRDQAGAPPAGGTTAAGTPQAPPLGVANPLARPQ